MRAALAMMLMAANAHSQVTVVKPNAGAVTITTMYYACWSRDGVRQACVAAGPGKADYDKIAAYLVKSAPGVSVFELVK